MVYFICDEEDPAFRNRGRDHYVDAWLELVPAQGRVKPVVGSVVTLEDTTAKDHTESGQLDLDHLPTRGGE